MTEKILLCGNEAIAEAAIQSGCRYYYGYPITPQNEISAYMSYRMPQVGGTFIQAESELAAINMVYGTATTGKRVLTSSSGPGISLKQEGISYLAGSELPAVIVNVMRAGPGLGNITPSQADYFQATRGGGHGDYRTIVLAPASVQESADLTKRAFVLADKYRIPVMLLLDGMQGQMREPVLIEPLKETEQFDKSWCLTGCKGRKPNIARSLYLEDKALPDLNERLLKRYAEIEKREIDVDQYKTGDADIVIVAYGTPARMCRSMVDLFRKKGVKVGLFRPITLWPFPYDLLEKTSKHTQEYLVVEWSAGQLIEDVRLALGKSKPIHFHGVLGGRLMKINEVESKLDSIIANMGAHI
ncbi:MAG: 3-methyl-2-oxobutanoate dehydrogenase subunit VorB [Candidatus Auribacterota bacterium]|jgi:2-oxoglutarate ferredoxin oxidoreductase subunit alpha|nr:3-methyl-2-oxobutanoate dehydrogenase subunit VorB [Candidatus Auribacterota bacterium]